MASGVVGIGHFGYMLKLELSELIESMWEEKNSVTGSGAGMQAALMVETP